MYAVGDRVYVIGLEAGRPVIMSTEAGTDNWQEEFSLTAGLKYSHGVSILVDGSIYYYLMKDGTADKRPIYVLRFDLNL